MPKKEKSGNLFTKMVQNAAFAENPAGLTASGWRANREGDIYVADPMSRENRQLAGTLAAIGVMPLTDLATGAVIGAAGNTLMKIPKVRNAVTSYNVAREINRGAKAYSKSSKAASSHLVPYSDGLYADVPIARELPVSSSDASLTRVKSYSGHVPTNQSKAQAFVDDIEEVLDWESKRGNIAPAKKDYIDFGNRYYRDYGREANVYANPDNPDEVLKVLHHRAVPGDNIYPVPYLETPEEAAAFGEEYVKMKNSRPYNLVENVVGVTHYGGGDGYYPVLSQKRVVPANKVIGKTDADIESAIKNLGERIGNTGPIREVESAGSKYVRPDGVKPVNNIVYENDFQKIVTDPYDGKMYLETKDLRKDNVGYLKDGSLIGFDLFKNGGDIHIKESKKGTFTAAAKAHGKSVQAFASQVLANKDNYSPAMVKKANFAHVFGGRHYSDGGYLLGNVYDVSESEYQRLLMLGYGVEKI